MNSFHMNSTPNKPKSSPEKQALPGLKPLPARSQLWLLSTLLWSSQRKKMQPTWNPPPQWGWLQHWYASSYLDKINLHKMRSQQESLAITKKVRQQCQQHFPSSDPPINHLIIILKVVPIFFSNYWSGFYNKQMNRIFLSLWSCHILEHVSFI